MKKTLKLILLGTLIAVGSQEVMAQQNTSTAVMGVGATVSNSSSISMNSSSKLQGGWHERIGENASEIKIGDFSITLPEGVEILSEVKDELKMINGSHSIDLSTTTQIIKNEDGSVTIEVTGKNENGTVARNGVYSGNKVTTIQYL